MDNQLLSLSKVFTERLFRIPDYQRGFAWGDKQLQDFWNDLMQLPCDKNHYTGVLTLEEVPAEAYSRWEDDLWIINSKGFSPYYVVDGQQRLTTSLILIQCILESTATDSSINYTSTADVQRKFIFDSKDGVISRSYIFGYDRDNPSYEHLKRGIFNDCMDAGSRLQETIYTHNLDFAKTFFLSRIATLQPDEREQLYKKVTQHLLFNFFSIAKEVEVCVAFETMNNRGKPLSYLELLKNRLIYLSLKFPDDEHERALLRREINECWKSIYHYLGRNKEHPLDDDEFLRCHYALYFGPLTPQKSDDGLTDPRAFFGFLDTDYSDFLLREHFISSNVVSVGSDGEQSRQPPVTLLSVHEYVESLKRSVEMWYRINSPNDGKFSNDITAWLDKLARLGDRSAHALVLAFFEEASSDELRLQFLKAVERSMFIESIVRWHHWHLLGKHWLFEAVKLKRGTMSPDDLIAAITETTRRTTEHSQFRSAMKEAFRGGFYTWSALRYFLYEYNLSLQSQSKTERRKILWNEFVESKEDYVTIEHVFPQRAQHPYWKSRFGHLAAKQRKALRESLGNLLPLSRAKNASLQNKPFPQKVDGDAERSIGFRFGSYAENEVCREGEWSPKQIKERGLKLLAFMEQRWAIRLGTPDEKLKLLNLSFMNG